MPAKKVHGSLFGSRSVAVLAKRFKVNRDSILGQGSFATVYKGLDKDQCRGVAVKVYNDTDEIAEQSFHKSITVLSMLHKETPLSSSSLAPPVASSSRLGSFVSGISSTPLASTNTVNRSIASPSPSFDPRAFLDPVSSLSCLKHLRESTGDDQLSEKLMDAVCYADCFVELLGHSCDEEGEAGLDQATGHFYLVFELGEESLMDVLERKRESGAGHSVEELRSLHWALVSIVCGLHSAGYVHLDIKPVNIVRFGPKVVSGSKSQDGSYSSSSRWKLIDLDGAAQTRQEEALTSLVCTPQYMPPEVARAVVNWRKAEDKTEHSNVMMSRLMDIWSVGMCALESIFMTPVLSVWYDEWMEETGSDEKFMQWLADVDSEAIVEGSMEDALSDIDPAMCKFLQGMLVRKESERLSVTELLSHEWLEPVRKVIIKEVENFVKSHLPAGMSTSGKLGGLSEDDEAAVKRSNSMCKKAVVRGVNSRTCVSM